MEANTISIYKKIIKLNVIYTWSMLLECFYFFWFPNTQYQSCLGIFVVC